MSFMFVFLITHIWWHLILSFHTINHYSAILFNNIFHFFSPFFVILTNSQSSITCVLNQSISFGVPKCNNGVYWPIKDTRKSHNCDWSFVFPSIVTDRMFLEKGASDEMILLQGIHCSWCIVQWCCQWSNLWRWIIFIYRGSWALQLWRSWTSDREFFQQPQRKAQTVLCIRGMNIAFLELIYSSRISLSFQTLLSILTFSTFFLVEQSMKRGYMV